jgi:ligand-binding sensor domain-containing protein
MKNCILLSLFCWFSACFCEFAIAQNLIPTGTWRTHLTYHNTKSLAITESKVYACSENALFYVDKSTKELHTISTSEGLSDRQFSKIAYHKNLKKLIITYRNGNIDLLTEENNQFKVLNINEIKTSNKLTNKQINHITIAENLAYLSMASGVVVIDLSRNKIFENYLQLGNGASTLETYSSAIVKDSIFLATEAGILAASLSPQINRQDPKNWQRLRISSPTIIRYLAAKNDKLYFAQDQIGVFEYNNGAITALTISEARGKNFINLTATTDKQNILVYLSNLVIQIDSQNRNKLLTQKEIATPQEADNEGNTLWIADNRTGLLNNATGQFVATYPRGTYNAASFDMLYVQEKILALSGGYNYFLNTENRNLGFYLFEQGEWKNYNTDTFLAGNFPIPNSRNIIQATYQATENKVYFATFGDGILVLDIAKNTVTNLTSPTLPSQKVTAIITDRRGALWIAVSQNSNNSPSIYKLENNTWRPFNLADFNPQGNETILQLLADEANNIWARVRSVNGQDFLAVVNERSQQKTLRRFSGEFQYAGTQINAMELDKEGNIWIGGNAGVRVLNSAISVISRNTVELSPVRFEQRQLFRDEAITAIKSDGGNRKWIATSQGVWLFSANGSEQILQFSTQNSPLLSNKVHAITIHEKTGEVFFATSEGIVSYRADATTANEDFSAIKIFPNPVPSNFQGVITIEGLTENSNIKITDISGRLVFETQSQGGTAVWRGTDYTGRRATTGIYLVFCTNSTGEQSIVGKIAVVE